MIALSGTYVFIDKIIISSILFQNREETRASVHAKLMSCIKPVGPLRVLAPAVIRNMEQRRGKYSLVQSNRLESTTENGRV